MANKKVKKDIVDNRFNIDFFEFAFLVEACIPPRPIARSMFWDKVCNYYYHQLTPDERSRLFDWITRNLCFKMENEDCRFFYARYNPENQYRATCVNNGKTEIFDCFLIGKTYYTSKSTSLNEKFIKEVTQINTCK